jgi:hypothetical protein
MTLSIPAFHTVIVRSRPKENVATRNLWDVTLNQHDKMPSYLSSGLYYRPIVHLLFPEI